MHQKTRYNVRLSQRKEVKFRFFSNEADVDNLWQLINETAKREGIRTYEKSYYRSLLSSTRLVSKNAENTPKQQLISALGVAELNGEALAAGIWLGFGDTLTYLHGGSSREHREVMAPYAMHWQMLNWAGGHGYKYYDWWGIEPADANAKLAGVTRFKLGFGGITHEFAGTYDYIYNQRKYKYFKFFKRLRSIFKYA